MYASRTSHIVMLAIAGLIGLLLAYLAFNRVYVSEAITAKVIDADTREPIQGAIVVTNWALKGLEGFVVGQMKIIETTTDSAGSFRVERWGPAINFTSGRIRSTEPTLRIFATGYEPVLLSNRPGRIEDITRTRQILHYSFNNRVIPMRRFRGEPESYIDALAPLMLSLRFVYSGQACEWTQVPKLITALQGARAHVNTNAAMQIPSISDIQPSAECGDPSKVLANN